MKPSRPLCCGSIPPAVGSPLHRKYIGEVVKTVATKTVVASMGAVAASGGYYVAAGADKIVASPGHHYR